MPRQNRRLNQTQTFSQSRSISTWTRHPSGPGAPGSEHVTEPAQKEVAIKKGNTPQIQQRIASKRSDPGEYLCGEGKVCVWVGGGGAKTNLGAFLSHFCL